MIEAFPLQWPAGHNRCFKKKRSPFKVTSLDQVRKGVLREIKLLGGNKPVISSNIPVRLDGQLYATMRPVGADHGVAVYFTWNNQQRVLACDSYGRIEDNLRAIELSIEGIRRPERYGIADALNSVFQGFKLMYLPEPTLLSKNNWWDVLEVDESASIDQIKDAYRALAKIYHPDMKPLGNQAKFNRIVDAYEKSFKR